MASENEDLEINTEHVSLTVGWELVNGKIDVCVDDDYEDEGAQIFINKDQAVSIIERLNSVFNIGHEDEIK